MSEQKKKTKKKHGFLYRILISPWFYFAKSEFTLINYLCIKPILLLTKHPVKVDSSTHPKNKNVHQTPLKDTSSCNPQKFDWPKIFITFFLVALFCIIIKYPWIFFLILVLFMLLLLIYRFTPSLHDIPRPSPETHSNTAENLKSKTSNLNTIEKPHTKKLSEKELSEFAYTCEMLARKKEKQEMYATESHLNQEE